MAKRSRHERMFQPIAFNATPMVDVIFMLTIFFMLVSTFSSKENLPMELPDPVESQARPSKIPDRVVINVVVSDETADGPPEALYRLGPNRPEPLGVIRRRLRDLKQQNPQIKVVVRADRRLPYGDVRALMLAVAAEEIEMLNVAAHLEQGGRQP